MTKSDLLMQDISCVSLWRKQCTKHTRRKFDLLLKPDINIVWHTKHKQFVKWIAENIFSLKINPYFPDSSELKSAI